MKYGIKFEYKPADESSPRDHKQDADFDFEGREFVPIPAVGDSVTYKEDDKVVARKVVSRHYSYYDRSSVGVNIVVTDLPSEEYDARIND